MPFDLTAMLKEVSESDTGREQIEYIRLDLLDSDEKNFYALSEVPSLADNIATVGLQQPLRVRKHPTAEGKYMIVSGHRRRAALELLVQDDPERWTEVPCIVEQDAVSPALQQLRLIFANSGTRKLSSADINEQAAQVEKLLYQLQEEGHEFPGRMRDHVAKVMQTTNTKLATLKKIREHLAECWQPLYKKGKLPENTAYEVAKIPLEDQQILFNIRTANNPRLGSFWADDAKAFAKACKEIEKLRCKRRGRPSECMNAENKKKRAAALHYFSPCYCTKCCGDCPDLINCKYACPVLAEKVKQMKADRKEANRQAKLDKEEVERPTIELLQRLWLRFACARKQAGVSIQETCKAAGYCYSAKAEKDIAELENCTAKFNVNNTGVPYGYHYHRSYIKALCAIADLFGCSVDFLLCRTDVSDMAQTCGVASEPDANSAAPELIPAAWYPARMEPPVGIPLITIDTDGFATDTKYKGCGEYDFYSGAPVCLWSLLPDDTNVPLTAPTVSSAWNTGKPASIGEYVALVLCGNSAVLHPYKLTWDGGEWLHRGHSLAETGVNVICWIGMPDEDQTSSESPLNNSCKTGMSPFGRCGAAACCDEPVDCCMNCDKDCNSRCGHTEEVFDVRSN